MLSKDRFRKILKALLEKSRQNQVNWLENEDNNLFFVEFPQGGRIVLKYSSPESDADHAVAVFFSNKQKVCALEAEDGEDDFQLLSDLYAEAYRNIVGWDKALEEIERQLKSDDSVGMPLGDVPF